MIRYTVSVLILSVQFSFAAPAPCDSAATPETVALFHSLQNLRGEKILFGHHMTTRFTVTPKPEGEARWSDVKAATGEWPAMWSFDLEFAVKDRQADNLREDIRFARRLGAAVTMSWHMGNLVTGGSFRDVNIDIASLLPGGKNHDKLLRQFSAAADFLATLTDDQGRPIPILFRPWHEFNLVNSFWWNKATPEELKALWRFTADYFQRQREIHNLLLVYAPCPRLALAMKSGPMSVYLAAYPGDEYVDVFGLDCYGDLRREGVIDILRAVVTEADRRGKIPALTETGVDTGQGYGKPDAPPDWFSNGLLEPLKKDPQTRRLAYAVTWYNKPGSFWVPYKPDLNGYAGFMEFFRDDWTAFSGDLKNLNLYGAKDLP